MSFNGSTFSLSFSILSIVTSLATEPSTASILAPNSSLFATTVFCCGANVIVTSFTAEFTIPSLTAIAFTTISPPKTEGAVTSNPPV